jgi:hypothetical protein
VKSPIGLEELERARLRGFAANSKTVADLYPPTPDEERERLRALDENKKRAIEDHHSLLAAAKRISENGTECLISNKLMHNERTMVIKIHEQFNRAMKNLSAIIQNTYSDPLKAELCRVTRDAISAAFILGHSDAPYEMIARMEKYWNAANMRKKRSQSPKELALQEAVFNLLEGEVVKQPMKMAVSFLDPVNDKLARLGFPPVSRYAINRRLKYIQNCQRLDGGALEDRTQGA